MVDHLPDGLHQSHRHCCCETFSVMWFVQAIILDLMVSCHIEGRGQPVELVTHAVPKVSPPNVRLVVLVVPCGGRSESPRFRVGCCVGLMWLLSGLASRSASSRVGQLDCIRFRNRFNASQRAFTRPKWPLSSPSSPPPARRSWPLPLAWMPALVAKHLPRLLHV